MNLTIDSLVNSIYKELSTRRVNRFTMTDLMKASSVSRGTIYYYFNNIEDIYTAAFEKNILNRVIEESDSFTSFINKFISYIYENKTFSLNFYHLTEIKIRKEFLIEIFNNQLLRFKININPKNLYVVSGFCFIIINCFDHDLELEQGLINKEIELYSQMLRKTLKNF